MSIKLPKNYFLGTPEVKAFPRKQYEKIKEIVDAINDLRPSDGVLNADTISEETSGSGVTVDGVILKDNKVTASGGISQGTSNVTEFTVLTTLTADQIVGTSAGDIGHSGGAILVAAPSSSYALEFVSAVLVFDYAAAAYTGGNNDAVIRVGTVAHTAALTDANYIKATGDKVYVVRALNTAELSLPVGSSINLAGTAFTQPGTAAGVLRVYTTYRVITTGL